ncbi:MAG: preprotein translocase subunit YajC [Microthrixaceae bacterium]|nr:preprotein translocase subunit YajC [Acidimicrobiales bacterium]MCB9403569.1 preprotein translocase subunit YajC [Microthrixaceae bacterium]
MPQLILTVLLIAIGWFLLIRPQQARVREQRATVAALEAGDDVITAGGIHGRITDVQPETVRIEISSGVVVTLARAAVVRRLDPNASNSPDSSAETTEPTSDPTQGDVS